MCTGNSHLNNCLQDIWNKKDEIDKWEQALKDLICCKKKTYKILTLLGCLNGNVFNTRGHLMLMFGAYQVLAE
jgi:hypothetical protein